MPAFEPSSPSSRSIDLLLVHAPAIFDFRNRRDLYFPYLCTSGDVPITPLYEYFPIGFKTLQRVLCERGFDVRIVNLSSVLLKYPRLDVEELLSRVNARLIGIDLHWMVHVQGSLAVAELLKRVHPDTPIIFGGISSTYYAHELIRYPFIDMVMRGYETHEPVARLLACLGVEQAMRDVDNLLWKSRRGEIIDNGFSYVPDSFACGVDWSSMPESGATRLPILEMLSTQNAGCAYNCGWCGGSRDAFRRINPKRKPMARKGLDQIALEFESMKSLPNVEQYHFYSVGSYNEPNDRMRFFLDHVAESSFKSISYEQYFLTSEEMLRRMAAASKRTVITLSPESHDPLVAKLSGRGVYTNEEMEQWLERALDIGIHQIDIWYFIGMPEQGEDSVKGTVEYCAHLLDRFKGQRVVPMLCPMIPFLDPASTFFEEPDKHGYRIFCRTADDHRRAMQRASLINRINYETRWLSREDIVRVGFNAVGELAEAKAEARMYPPSLARSIRRRIADSLEFLGEVHRIDCIPDEAERACELERIGDEIAARNHEIFFDGVANQAFPIPRDVGGRWFDEMLWPEEDLEQFAATAMEKIG
jgi:clorobiocin/coumermycin A biosynthesis protein CloN6/CouN6